MAGESIRQLAKQFGIGATSLRDHKAAHLSPSLVAVALHSGAAGQVLGLVDQLRKLVDQAEAVLAAAIADKNGSQALAAIREKRATLEIVGRATGELKERPAVSVNLQTTPEWVALRSAIFEAVPPELRLGLAKKLQGLESPRES